MLKICAATTLALLLHAGDLRADKFKATLRSVDAEKSVITVTLAAPAGGKDVEYAVAPGARIIRGNGQKPLDEGLKHPLFKPGAEVTLTTEKRDGKEVVI